MSDGRQTRSRRAFLARTVGLGAGAGLALAGRAWANPATSDPLRFALWSDIHIPTDRATILRNVNPVDDLCAARRAILAQPSRPAAVIVSGDCACMQGLDGDYTTLREETAALGAAGVPVHFALGNHDSREHFWNAFPEARPATPPVADKHVALIETPVARWILLDSLDHTNVTPGLLGPAQRDWLVRTLDAAPHTPALVVVHHNPDPLARYGQVKGLADTDELLGILLPRQQVKALFFGHTHVWTHGTRQGLHLVNLPALAWVFDPKQPRGWVDATLAADHMELALHTLDPQHPAAGQTCKLAWR